MKNTSKSDGGQKRRDFVKISALSGLSATILGLLPAKLFGSGNKSLAGKQKSKSIPVVKIHPSAIKRNNKG